MSRITIHPGIRYEHEGCFFEIRKVHVEQGKLEVLDLSTGLSSTIEADTITRGLFDEHNLRFEVSGKNKKPVRDGWFSTAYQAADFDHAGKHQQEAWDRYLIVRAVLEHLREGEDWGTAYKEGLKKVSADGLSIPSMRTVQRWVSAFSKGNTDPRSLVPHGRRRRRKRAFPDEIEEAMSFAVSEKYLSQRRPKLGGAYLKMINLIADKNTATDGIMDSLRVPSLSTFRRRM
jgi:hypothetical protein